MRSLSIQIQPGRSLGLDMAAIGEVFASIAADSTLVRHHAFDQGHDAVVYHNFTFGTERAADLWREIRRRLFDDPALGKNLRKASIAMCSSESGWLRATCSCFTSMRT